MLIRWFTTVMGLSIGRTLFPDECGLYRYLNLAGRWGFCFADGTPASGPFYEFAFGFVGGRALVSAAGECFYVDRSFHRIETGRPRPSRSSSRDGHLFVLLLFLFTAILYKYEYYVQNNSAFDLAHLTPGRFVLN